MKTYKTILTIGNKNFCAFCGDEINYDNTGQLICDCNDSKLYRNALHTALQLEMEANKTMNNAPKPRYELQTVCRPISSNANTDTTENDEPSVCI